MIDDELAELVGRIGNLYTKRGLSPPFFLRDAARNGVVSARTRLSPSSISTSAITATVTSRAQVINTSTWCGRQSARRSKPSTPTIATPTASLSDRCASIVAGCGLSPTLVGSMSSTIRTMAVPVRKTTRPTHDAASRGVAPSLARAVGRDDRLRHSVRRFPRIHWSTCRRTAHALVRAPPRPDKSGDRWITPTF
jgi:hypothetical protein